MTPAAELSVAERLVELFKHLGIERAHFAASMLADLQALRRRIRNVSHR